MFVTGTIPDKIITLVLGIKFNKLVFIYTKLFEAIRC